MPLSPRFAPVSQGPGPCQVDTVTFSVCLHEYKLWDGKTKSPGRWHSHLGEELHEAAVVGELQVSGVELMESSNVTLDQVLLLVVQLVQICEKQSVSTETLGPSCYKQQGGHRQALENTFPMTWSK